MRRLSSPELIGLFACLFAWMGSAALNHQIRGWDTAFVEAPIQARGKTHPRLFQLMTFGHWPLGVDWLWIKTLQDPALQHVEPGTHPAVYEALDLATDLDPAYFEAYTMGANLLAVVRNDGEGARDLLLKGERFRKQELPQWGSAFRERYWKNEWLVPMLLGYVQLFELGDLPKAAVAFREAGEYPSAPEYLRSMSIRLSQPGGEYEVGIRVLRFLLSGAQDLAARQKFEKRLRSLHVGQHVFHVQRAFGEFLGQQSGYQRRTSLSPAQMQSYWRRFLKESKTADRDPFGGKLSLTAAGKVTSSTPRERVFGLE